ncbi:LiaI-LiaF-like domain-containing protein, partial [Oceanobacillus massiliensis]
MNNLFRYFLAVFLITIGVMLVMANVGVVSFNLNLAWQYIYPIFFVVIGINWLFGFFRKRGGSWEMGSFLLLFGSLLLMDRMDWIVFTFWDIFKLWPLLIVYIGFNLFRRERFTGEYGSGKEWKKGDFSMFTVGDHEYSEP